MIGTAGDGARAEWPLDAAPLNSGPLDVAPLNSGPLNLGPFGTEGRLMERPEKLAMGLWGDGGYE